MARSLLVAGGGDPTSRAETHMRQPIYELALVSILIGASVANTVFAEARPVIEATNLLSSKKGWRDTGADNSLKKKKSLFKLQKGKTGRVLRTKSTDVNIHSHYSRAGIAAQRSYTYTGRMRTAEANGGIGVTFYSKYPKADKYYRLRRYADNDFHLSPHGTEITSGKTSTGVVPKPGIWYRFKILVKTQRTRVRIYAKVWKLGSREPKKWQVDCVDSSSTRITRGKPGVWSMADGTKMWADLKISN